MTNSLTGRARTGILMAWLSVVGNGLAEEIDPVSPSGLRYYAQGGVVLDGVAYFTSDDGGCVDTGRSDAYPAVVAFDIDSFRKLRTYRFAKTYDSSPLLFQKKDGTWLIIAHEHKKKRTMAIGRDTGNVAWTGAANQPGAYFFGYSYYRAGDGSKIIFAACQNGLHAMSGETGEDLWFVARKSTGGITPCVDQAHGWVYYQRNGEVLKLRATDGKILESVAVPGPNVCISWNTVLVDDENGYFVATRWYGRPTWDSALRIYDADLNLVWEKTRLPHGKKATLTYAQGKLVVGSGNGWKADYTDDTWKYLAAYRVTDGNEAWRCDLKAFPYKSILNTLYFGGGFYAETQDGEETTSKIFRIDAAGGELLEVLDFGRPVTSCATSIIAGGKIYSGDLHQDGIVVTRIAENATADWPGPFGDPQTNQMAAPDEPNAKPVKMRELSNNETN